MLVIVGATGNTGSKITDILLTRKERVRAVGRDAGKLKPFTDRGGEAAVGDLNDPGFAVKAFTGADAVYTLIPPNFQTGDFRGFQRRIADNIAAAIERNGVRYVINLSSQGADRPEGTGPIVGLHEMEDRLNALAGVNVLHLRAAYFMENLSMNISLIKRSGIMGSAIRGDLRIPMIAAKDISGRATELLVRRDFTGQRVQDLLGQRDVSMDEVAGIIGRKIGRPGLRYVQFSYEETEKALIEMGLSKDLSRLYVEMSRAFNDGVVVAGKRTQESTTPTSIEEFADVFARVYGATEKAA